MFRCSWRSERTRENRFRDRRKALALRQLDLAGLGGTGNRFVVDVENGKPTVQLQKVIDLMALLGLDFVVRPRGGPDR